MLGACRRSVLRPSALSGVAVLVVVLVATIGTLAAPAAQAAISPTSPTSGPFGYLVWLQDVPACVPARDNELAFVRARVNGRPLYPFFPYKDGGGANGLGAILKIARLGAYHDSVVDGRRWLRDRVKRQIKLCGTKTKIFLTGFSQGAQVTADTYQRDLRAEQRRYVTGVALFGDPYFNHRDEKARRGNHQWVSGVLGRRRREFNNSRVVSYCHKWDPVCQVISEFRLIQNGFSKHFDYGVVDGAAAAHYLSRR
jgi:hypothetical protein